MITKPKALHFILYATIISMLTISCSSDESPVEDNDNSKEVPEEKIGLQILGVPNSSDAGRKIFPSNNGYISFENKNVHYTNFSEGTSNLLIRTLDEKLKSIDSVEIKTDSYDLIEDVVKLDDTKYLVTGSFSLGSPLSNIYPVLKIINTQGEIVNSLVIGSPQTTALTNFGDISGIYHKDNVIYVTVKLEGAQSSVIALNSNLELLWSKLYDNARSSKIYADSEHVYFVNKINNPEDDLYNIMQLNKLNKDTGETILQKTFKNAEGGSNLGFTVFKMIENNGKFYLAGYGHNTENKQQGLILKINKDNFSEEARTFYSNLENINDIEITKNGYVISGTTNEIFINISKIGENGSVVWEYEYNQAFNDIVNDIMLVSDYNVLFTGSVDQGNAPDRDVVIGILDAEGKLN